MVEQREGKSGDMADREGVDIQADGWLVGGDLWMRGVGDGWMDGRMAEATHSGPSEYDMGGELGVFGFLVVLFPMGKYLGP